ncbi:hypothetical protein DPMN_014494 [Dreissena polymorpha]|uniref:DUF4371 domain-containing protein n=1 Tax=Dreissena polymorpha TaxID=45954 RepID=A0A9D4S4Q5_DREPO|nr:hypothetical protein DPMN_014494 [Dreissena polymorpha]
MTKLVLSFVPPCPEPFATTLYQTYRCSLIIDETTDFTGDDMETLYVRISSNGYVRDIFLDIGCSTSACITDIYSHVQVFQDLELTDVIKDKLARFCSDGAANMMVGLV